jgi:hypothetical protein
VIDRVLWDRTSKDCTINTMTNVSRYNVDRRILAKTSVSYVFPTYRSETRVDIALLASALFLQRFGLPFFHTRLTFDFVFAVLIFVHQFASGRLFIQYDRLLWFLVVVLAATSSLLLNFESTMLTSYGLFVLIYFLFTLSRPCTPDQYKSTLRGFQFLVLILSCLAIAQFAAQFVVSGKKIIMFYGLVPDFLLAPGGGDNIGNWGESSLIKSNGVFLPEPSTMSQMAAFGILIECLEFRRPRYLVVLTLGLLLAFSGTGITILLLSLPLAVLVNQRAQLPVMLVSLLAFGLFASGIINPSAFTSRLGEFEDTHASGFLRFVSPFWMAVDYFDTASLPELLRGNGPGGIGFRPSRGGGNLIYHASGSSWFNLIYYYGLIGAFVFTCFFGYCFRRSRCPRPLIAALIYLQWVIGNVVGTSTLIMMVVLCTLNGPEPRRRRIDETGQYRSSLAARSVAG